MPLAMPAFNIHNSVCLVGLVGMANMIGDTASYDWVVRQLGEQSRDRSGVTQVTPWTAWAIVNKEAEYC